MTNQTVKRATEAGQSSRGLAYAGLILSAWLALHVFGVWFNAWTALDWLTAPVAIALQTWLSAGLFIVAHDAMHGSLAPGRPWLNRLAGRVLLLLYAGFWFDRLQAKHLAHHAHPGSADDPDYAAQQRDGFWPWYVNFFRTYFGLRELAVLSFAVLVYVLLGVSIPNMLAFWALPALLSSLQLFAFGTYLPHRRSSQPFEDGHNARSLGYARLGSLLSCYHFGGYHLVHHRRPHVPWWRLPAG